LICDIEYDFVFVCYIRLAWCYPR